MPHRPETWTDAVLDNSFVFADIDISVFLLFIVVFLHVSRARS